MFQSLYYKLHKLLNGMNHFSLHLKAEMHLSLTFTHRHLTTLLHKQNQSSQLPRIQIIQTSQFCHFFSSLFIHIINVTYTFHIFIL